jgi:sugar transferase (PEP-CTERM/EpsH1 system associated)
LEGEEMERENHPATAPHAPDAAGVASAPGPAGDGKDLLLLAPRLPCLGERGHRQRWYYLLRYLARNYRVHLGCFADPARDRAQLGHIKALCYETCFVEAPRADRMRTLRALARGEPTVLQRYRNATLADWVERLMRRQPIQAAVACSARMADYLAGPAECVTLLDFVELESQRRLGKAAGLRWPMGALWQRDAARQLEHERALAARFQHLLFASSAQASLFAGLAPESAHKASVVANGVDCDYFSPHIVHRNPFEAGARALLFAGTLDDPADAAAASWFARHVFAPLHARDPALRFFVLGARPAPRLRALAGIEGVVLAGAVPDARPYLAHAALVVAPQQSPHGQPHKLLEALAMRKLVVAAPPAPAGLGLAAGTELLAADGADAFLALVDAALRAPPQQLPKAARARVLGEHGWDRALAPLGALLEAGQTRRARVR